MPTLCVTKALFRKLTVPFLAIQISIIGLSCGSGGSKTTLSGAKKLPHSDHIFVLMLENHSFSEIFPAGDASDCSASDMPYLCGLASHGALALNFYSNVHGSLWSYLLNSSGSQWIDHPFNCNGNKCSAPGVVVGDNIVRALLAGGKTWHAYLEDLPAPGFAGGNQAAYVDRHNPFKWYADVLATPEQQTSMVPFAQFANDIANGTFFNYTYIVPNVLHDAHGTGTQTATQLMSNSDTWIQTNIAPLLATHLFQTGGDGVLIITFDESALDRASGDTFSDDACSPSITTGCGGHIPLVIVSPLVSSGTTNTQVYHFEDMLHTTISLLGLNDYMNASATASDITVF